MIFELLSYQTSFGNPLLKLGIIVLFAFSTWYFWRCRRMYGGILNRISNLLLIGSEVGVIASVFRFQGDLFLQFKWGESIMDLILALVTLGIAVIITRKLTQASRVFGTETRVQEDE